MPAASGNPISIREEDKYGEIIKGILSGIPCLSKVADTGAIEPEKSIKNEISDLSSLAWVNCLSVGPPNSLILKLESGFIPIVLNNVLTLWIVPFEDIISWIFVKTLLQIWFWTNWRDKEFVLTSKFIFSALKNCSGVASRNREGILKPYCSAKNGRSWSETEFLSS